MEGNLPSVLFFCGVFLARGVGNHLDKMLVILYTNIGRNLGKLNHFSRWYSSDIREKRSITMKQTIRKRALILVAAVLIIALIVSVGSLVQTILGISDESIISIVISFLETTGLLISLIVAVRQLTDSKEIARADFLVELNRTFTESSGNTELYTALQNCMDHQCEYQDQCNRKNCLLTFPKVVVSNYLTFFETIYLLEKNGVITYSMIDDLFAYRFFLAVHSPFVQQVKLAPQPENFKNIFCLEYEWMQYRAKKAKKVDGAQSVYQRLPLKDLMNTEERKQLYAQWIKECRKF